MSPRVDTSMSASEIRSFLEEPRTGVLSTLDRHGAPHAAGMWFALSGTDVLMWTYAKSQKAVNVRRDPRVAFLVEHGDTYNSLKGVLVRGRARIVVDLASLISIGRALYERYTLPRTGIPVEEGPVVEIERQATKRIGVALGLTEVASWDHSKLSLQRRDA